MRVRRVIAGAVVAPIRLYQRIISPLKPVSTCRFSPTCSSYAIEAVTRRGVVVGVFLAIWRIVRCNPFSKSGYDPVPLPVGAVVTGQEPVEEA